MKIIVSTRWEKLHDFRWAHQFLNYKYFVLCLYVCQYNGNGLQLFNSFYLLQMFLWIFFRKCDTLLHLRVILVPFLLSVTFFSFRSKLYFSPVFFNDSKKISYNLPHDINYACFFILPNAEISEIEYTQGICFPILVAEDFSGLFWHTAWEPTFFIKTLNIINMFSWFSANEGNIIFLVKWKLNKISYFLQFPIAFLTNQ